MKIEHASRCLNAGVLLGIGSWLEVRDAVKSERLRREPPRHRSPHRRRAALAVPVWIILAVLPFGRGAAIAAEIRVDANSAYVWRGLTINDGFVVQPSLDLPGPRGFGINVWANIDLNEYGQYRPNEISEVDLTLSWTASVRSLEIGFGWMEYLYPYQGASSSAPGTREVYATLSRPLPGGISATVAIHQDIKEIRGVYSEVSVDRTVELPRNLQGGASIGAGYAGETWAWRSASGLQGGPFDWNVRCGLSRAFLGAEVELNANFTKSLDTKALPEQEIHFWSGVAISTSF